jgi:hypothetical protein
MEMMCVRNLTINSHQNAASSPLTAGLSLRDDKEVILAAVQQINGLWCFTSRKHCSLLMQLPLEFER